MNRTTLAAAMCLPFAGCLSLPPGLESSVAEVRSTTPIESTSSRPPAAVAACALANIDGLGGRFDPSTRDGLSTGSKEVRIRAAEAGVAGIVEIEPTAGGSAIRAYVSRHYLARATTAGAWLKDC